MWPFLLGLYTYICKSYFHTLIYLEYKSRYKTKLMVFDRFPLKAVKVMHTVALRTEATITGGETPADLGQVFKV